VRHPIECSDEESTDVVMAYVLTPAAGPGWEAVFELVLRYRVVMAHGADTGAYAFPDACLSSLAPCAGCTHLRE
jgi:hypothetical protein